MKDSNRNSDAKADDVTDDASGETQRNRSKNENPPRTTTGKLTSPKFGSAGSGGAELEPGPERD